MLYFPGQGWHMKRKKSFWTDCFAFLKTNSCYLLSGLNEPIPLGCAARPRGMHGLDTGVFRPTFNQGRGKRDQHPGNSDPFYPLWSAPKLFVLSSRILNLC